MFLGEYRNKMDKKGRIAIPFKFHSELGDNIIINRYYSDGCLAIYTEDAWKEKYLPLISRPDFKADVRELTRVLTSSAVNLQVDSQGRILVPAKLIKIAGLDSQCVFIGAGDHVELWSEEKWDNYSDQLTDEEIERISESL
jgi:MraZ protein